MRKSATLLFAFSLLAVGYLLGAANSLSPTSLWAQGDNNAAKAAVSDDTLDKIAAARDALQDAHDALVSEGLYKPATKGLNPIDILAGGVNVQADLEAGMGVDPGTFAALYAGLAIDEVDEQLGRDAEGRLTYKKRLIQMYPVTQIKRLYQAAGVVTEDN